MLADMKREIILGEGVPVDVLNSTGVLFSTNALIGKASSQSPSQVSLENEKRIIFVPDLPVTNGLIARNSISNESYLIVSSFTEVSGSEILSFACRTFQCNSKVTIKTFQEVADDYGNVTKSDVIKADNLDVYLEVASSELKLYNVGLKEDTVYRLYAPLFNVALMDKITISVNGIEKSFKVHGVDPFVFPGIVIIDVCTETRS